VKKVIVILSLYCAERYYGSFQRVFQLPTSVQVDKVEATFDKGVLKVTIPKAEEAKKRKFDREMVFIGSFNLGARSRIQNTEIGVVFESADIANSMAEGFDQKNNQFAFML